MAGLEHSSDGHCGRVRLFLAAAVMAALLLPAISALAGDKSENLSPRAKMGSALFQQNCIVCHNKKPGDTAPFGPPNLHGVLRKKVITAAQAATIIKNGRGAMPPFGSRLSVSQIQQLIAYLHTQ
jgi:mono/diheme cytochrome c family protein